MGVTSIREDMVILSKNSSYLMSSSARNEVIFISEEQFPLSEQAAIISIR